MIFCLILFSLFVSTLQVSPDVIAALASINAKGYPESILYETVSGASGRSMTPRSKESLIAALTSPEVENRLRVAAMEYAMSKLEPPHQRQLMETTTLMSRDGSGSSDCSYSWWSWVPWANCPAERTEDSLDPNKAGEIYAKCFK